MALVFFFIMALVFKNGTTSVPFEAKYELAPRYLEYNISGCELHEKIQIRA